MATGSATIAAHGMVGAGPAQPAIRALIPREHGAYGQLAFPLLTALAITPWSFAGLAMAGAAVALFFAHEPALVMLGHRGVRAQREHGDRAWRLLVVLTGIAGSLGGIGVALSPLNAQVAVALPLVLGAGLAVLVFRKAEKTTLGEMLAASTLSLAALPVMIANGASPVLASVVSAVWVTAFAVATLSVRGLLALHKARACAGLWSAMLSVVIISLSASTGAALLGFVSALAPVALLPMTALAAVLVLIRPPARRLREIGWSIVGTCAVMALVLIAASH